MKNHNIKKTKLRKVHRNEKVQKASNMCYKYSLLTVLGLTKALSRADYHIPSKWYSLIDSIRASSSILHGKVSTFDEEIEEDFRQKEDMIDRRLGKKKFYNEEDVEKIHKKFGELQI